VGEAADADAFAESFPTMTLDELGEYRLEGEAVERVVRLVGHAAAPP
jgi:hypothetical protein